jgi:hypothetical protein
MLKRRAIMSENKINKGKSHLTISLRDFHGILKTVALLLAIVQKENIAQKKTTISAEIYSKECLKLECNELISWLITIAFLFVALGH